MRSLPILLGLVTTAALAPACTSSSTSSRGQMITCTTDPGTAVILSCEPGEGSGGANECHDVDEDGDGDCHDAGETGSGSGVGLRAHDGSDDGSEGDSDGDGVPDTEDCDNHPGEDGGDSDGLPYDVRPQLGDTTAPIVDAFAERGGQPAAIVSVTMDGGGDWRMTELLAGTAFVVTQDDCTHAGNRDIGRDRVVVTWQDTAGGVTRADHLDIRYCK